MRCAWPLLTPALLVLAACAPHPSAPPPPAEAADAFIARVSTELEAVNRENQAAGFVSETYITPDTQALAAKANERYLTALSGAVNEAKRYDGAPLSAPQARALMKLRLNVSAPAPADPGKRARLAELAAGLDAKYGAGKYCPGNGKPCLNLDQLSKIMGSSRNYQELLVAWKGWHDVGASMRADYTEFVGLANEGARELGFKDLGVLWRAGYDMPPEDFDRESERLWQQVKPLYDALHCYTRVQLTRHYGADKVPPGQPIPAHLLGNMWAQSWGKLYGDLLKPYPNAKVENADAQLARQHWDAIRMARSAESFYTSLGFPQLPKSFWERSMFVRPRDREVVCHANAWDMGTRGDVRVKVCLEPNDEDLYTIYHELGHIYYDLSYQDQPFLFRDGANDGFHEAIGDTVNLSVTPAYLAKIGLVSPVPRSHDALIDQQMKMALDKIAFLPFGRLIDQWRWRVFSGEITPEHYNATWWELRRRYQGIVPPVPRSEADFDPAAKFHVPDNTPYTRYFLSFILQFQFHKALCQAAGFKGPLYECSVFGNAAAGEKFRAMLAAGASQPWQDTLEKLTGSRQIDAAAIGEYFQPLLEWLRQKNQNEQCGW
ncbi:MAG: M2 family metallopeptidase [Gammaproteobacteria bacterium]|nr:M2 family metallopeptidase [Gammaproteobacteria bacterium]